MRILVIALFMTLTASASEKTKAPETKAKPEIEKSTAELRTELSKEQIPVKRFYLKTSIVRRAVTDPIDSFDSKLAVTEANELLESSKEFVKDWNYGNAVHYANLALGRARLKDSDLAGAKDFLKRAGQTPGSPQLNSFGPNMTLAKELLEKNEKAAVIAYFSDVQKFWSSQFAKPKIDKWKQDIEAGHTPEFGANLVY